MSKIKRNRFFWDLPKETKMLTTRSEEATQKREAVIYRRAAKLA
jgi:hypothetical protein